MTTFGEELRRERELRGISLREVAEATKINIRFLEALERNDFASLHGGLYNRGIVRAYCEFIGVDAEGMVNAYLLEEQARADRRPAGADGLLRGRAAPGDVPPPAPRPGAEPASSATRWLLWVLVLAALVASLLLYIRFTDAGDEPPADGDPRAERSGGSGPGGGRV